MKSPNRCVWVNEDGVWATACGYKQRFYFNGGPRENMQRYCGFCGRRIIEAVHDDFDKDATVDVRQ
ncbi:MAG: hypothetical protein OEQ39_02905 [Gammaproteobacteria bacterium]|nr:hypothetical protein [Gammaproteobacteria bacterium]MDH3375899.1 hypothetical protein [Gammaproteobacteria bacterium]